jgi:predicted nucleotidyltransferase
MASKKTKGATAEKSGASSSAIISLEKVCSTLDIPVSDVLHAFVLGSRLWGTSNEDSDYDTYIVIKNTSAWASRLSSQKSFASIHSANIDAIVMLESNYTDRIRESGVFDLVTIWLPVDFVLKTVGLLQWKPDLQALFASCDKVLKRDLLMAQKHAENGKYDKAKKVITHTTRMIMMATQIVQHGKVQDWKCANDLFELLRYSYHLNSWEAFVEEVLPTQQQEWATFKASLPFPTDLN